MPGGPGSARRTWAAKAAATSARIAGAVRDRSESDGVRVPVVPVRQRQQCGQRVPGPQRRQRVVRVGRARFPAAGRVRHARCAAPPSCRRPAPRRPAAAPRGPPAGPAPGDPERAADAPHRGGAASRAASRTPPSGRPPRPIRRRTTSLSQRSRRRPGPRARQRPVETSVMLRYPIGAAGSATTGGSRRSRCRTRTSRAALGNAARHSCVAQPQALAPSATRSSVKPPLVSCITFVNSSTRNRSAMSARCCRSPVQPAATDSGIDDPYSNAAITRRACAADTTPSRAAAATPAARRSISLRVRRPFTGSRGRRARRARPLASGSAVAGRHAGHVCGD